MAKHLLTTGEIKNAQPGKHKDGEGLWLVVGNKLNKDRVYPKKWVLRIQFRGKRHHIGLGGARAKVDVVRAAANRLRDHAKSGGSPVEAWKAEKGRSGSDPYIRGRRTASACRTHQFFEERKTHQAVD